MAAVFLIEEQSVQLTLENRPIDLMIFYSNITNPNKLGGNLPLYCNNSKPALSIKTEVLLFFYNFC